MTAMKRFMLATSVMLAGVSAIGAAPQARECPGGGSFSGKIDGSSNAFAGCAYFRETKHGMAIILADKIPVAERTLQFHRVSGGPEAEVPDEIIDGCNDLDPADVEGPLADHFGAVWVQKDGEDLIVGVSCTGTITVESATAERVKGSYEVTMQVNVAGMDKQREVKISGEFTAGRAVTK